MPSPGPTWERRSEGPKSKGVAVMRQVGDGHAP